MRAHSLAYQVYSPASLDEALTLLAQKQGSVKPLAGGTDLMVLLEAGALKPGEYVNIWGLQALRGVRETDEGVEIGALCTYSDVLNNKTLARDFSLLCQAARETGAVAIQNRGTLAGNIANASPAADSPPALLAYNAQLELVSLRGKRRVDYSRFHLGYKKMDLQPDELISRIFLPKCKPLLSTYYRKVGARRAQAIAKVGMAAAAEVRAGALCDVRLAFSSIAPTPLRAQKTESVLEGKSLTHRLVKDALDTLTTEIAPIDDIRSTSYYRQKVAINLLEDFLLRSVDLG
jgi:CO/xanthine dehydrogenase FAD-binding subunit